ncbi:MAG: hypothetical protein AAF961_13885, partial [Planctomycetota bacterium]
MSGIRPLRSPLAAPFSEELLIASRWGVAGGFDSDDGFAAVDSHTFARRICRHCGDDASPTVRPPQRKDASTLETSSPGRRLCRRAGSTWLAP